LELAEARYMTTFVHLVKVAGLEGTFSDFGDYTLFAPTEAAFASESSKVLLAEISINHGIIFTISNG
jgi:uncharacterized surface protein with fasciclin (FAS1) repeats